METHMANLKVKRTKLPENQNQSKGLKTEQCINIFDSNFAEQTKKLDQKIRNLDSNDDFKRFATKEQEMITDMNGFIKNYKNEGEKSLDV